MALDDPLWLRTAFREVIEVAGEAKAYNEIIGSASRPDDADLVVRNTDNAFITHAPCLSAFPDLSIPYLYGLVGAGCDEPFRVASPGNTEDAALVVIDSDLGSYFAGFAIVEPNFAVSTDADKGGAVGTESDTVDKAIVLGAERGVEFERGAVVEDKGGVVATGCCAPIRE